MASGREGTGKAGPPRKQKKSARSDSEEEEGEISRSEKGTSSDRSSEEESENSEEAFSGERSEDDADADLTIGIVAKAQTRLVSRETSYTGSARTSGIRTSQPLQTSSSDEARARGKARVGKTEGKRKIVDDSRHTPMTDYERFKMERLEKVAKQGVKPLDDQMEEGEMRKEGGNSEDILENKKDSGEAAELPGSVMKKKKSSKVPDGDPETSHTPPGDNLAMRKLLRGVRYFDPPEEQGELCYNCGGRGHKSFDCTESRRERPCYVCGEFGHEGKDCSQRTQCFHCNKVGHRARDCPSKGHQVAVEESGSSPICMRCGRKGHGVTQCSDDYYPEDLKLVQCYTCKRKGHLCCAEFEDGPPDQLSCFNCGETGHLGGVRGCIRFRRTASMNEEASQPSMVCYACGEEGHIARSCPQPNQNGGRAGGSRRDMDGGKSSVTCFTCGGEGHFARDCNGQGQGGWPAPPGGDTWHRDMYRQNSHDRSPWHNERGGGYSSYPQWNQGGTPGGSRQRGWNADGDGMGRTWDTVGSRGNDRWGSEDFDRRWQGEARDSRHAGNRSQGGGRGYDAYGAEDWYGNYESPVPMVKNKAEKQNRGRPRERLNGEERKHGRSRDMDGGSGKKEKRSGGRERSSHRSAERSAPSGNGHGQRHKSSSKKARQ